MKPGRRLVGGAIALGALSILATAPLYASYLTADFWIASAIGVAAGTVIGAVGAMRRWGILIVAALTVVAYFALGSVAVFRDTAILGFIPTLDVLAALAVGAVHAWKEMLTLPDPLTGFSVLLIVPFLGGLLTSVVAVSLGLRLRRYGLALVPLALAFGGSIALSSYRAFHPAIIGAVFAAGAVAWLVWRNRLSRQAHALDDVAPAAGRRATLFAGVAAVVVAATVVGAAAAAAAPGDARNVVRDHVIPPLDLHDYATPLTSFRKWILDGEETALFRIDGLPAGTRVRLATLDLYDGIVYKVSGSGGAGSGTFTRVGREIDSDGAGDTVHATVTIENLRDVWMPTVGSLSSIGFAGSAAERNDSLHYNAATGTAVTTTGLNSGDVYAFDAVIPEQVGDDILADVEVASITTPAPEAVPEQIVAVLDSVADATTPISQLRALEAYFAETGFYSDGLEGKVPSRAGHGLSRQTELLTGEQMIGGAEQYAVAMALATAQLGIPVRVVMGFETDAAPAAVTGEAVTAWVEVPFEGHGWVAFDPTPSKDREPQEITQEQNQKPRVQVAQPPDPPQDPAELPPPPPVEEAADGEETVDYAWLWMLVQIAAGVLVVLLIALGPALVLALVRGRRRRARRRAVRPADRVGGAWAEVVDRAVDVGAPVASGATRREQGVALDDAYPVAGVAVLAQRADAVVFGPGEPSAEQIEGYWRDVDSATKRIDAATPWHRRVRAFFFPASVLRRRPRPARGAGGGAS